MRGEELLQRCRRAYFALSQHLGFDEDARHEFNLDNVGIESTKDFGLPHWLMAVSCLQIASGRPNVVPGHPHLKGLHPQHLTPDTDDPYPLDGSATRSQIAMIQGLAARKMRNPDALPNLIRRHAFASRQAGLAAQWRGTLATLPRAVAARTIMILRRLPAPGPAAHIPAFCERCLRPLTGWFVDGNPELSPCRQCLRLCCDRCVSSDDYYGVVCRTCRGEDEGAVH